MIYLLLSLALALFVAWSLVRAAIHGERSFGGRLDHSAEDQAQITNGIDDLELDLLTGKIEQGDYDRERSALMARLGAISTGESRSE